VALALALLFDERTDRAMRQLWDRLEGQGVPSLRSHTHGRHVPHLSYAVLRAWDLPAVIEAVATLPDAGPVDLPFDALGLFRRGRAWLAPAATSLLFSRQERAVEALTGAGGDLHKHYLPGVWVPHCTLAPRVPLAAMPTLAAAVYDMLPLQARVTAAALIDSGVGEVYPLATIP
jgi:2'-5' RNA ligase superfamily